MAVGRPLTPAIPQIKPNDLKDQTLNQLNQNFSTIWQKVVTLSGGAGTITIPNTIQATSFQNPGQTTTPSSSSELITLQTALGLFSPANTRAASLQGAFQTSATNVQSVQPLPSGSASSPAPTSSSSPGTPGQLAYDANFVYVCVSQNQWGRAALSSF